MHETNTREYWTPQRREEHKLRAVAHKMCKTGQFLEAEKYCLEHKISYPPFKKSPTKPPEPLPEPKFDRRSITSVENGKKGGAPLGNTNGTHTARNVTVSDAVLVEVMKETIVQGGLAGIKVSPRLGEMTIADRATLMRIAKVSVEEFNAELADALGHLAKTLVASLQKDVDEGRLKPGEKAFATAIAVDKRAALDGRLQVSGANVSIQVNQFNGPISRDELMKRLNPNTTQPTLPPAINIDPPAP